MKPGKPQPIYELLKNKNDFLTQHDLLPNAKSGAFRSIAKYEYPPNSEHYVCFKNFIDRYMNYEQKLYQLKRFFREITICNMVRHPCIVELRYFDIRETVQKSAVVETYYMKGSLYNVFQKGSIQAYNKIGKKTNPNKPGTPYMILLYGIARGIRYLHELGIMHRDIKPENIVVDSDYRSYITDFDLAKPTKDEVVQTMEMGTDKFMAPEVKGKDNVYEFSYPADVYSLSKVFYCLTEGLKSNILQIYNNLEKVKDTHNNSDLPFLVTPSGLRDLIEKMWVYDDKERPTMDEVCEELEKEENWFDETDSDEFMNYKKMIDDFEKVQIPIIKSKPLLYVNESIDYKGIMSFFEDSENDFYRGFMFFTGMLAIPRDYVLAWKFLERAKESQKEKIESEFARDVQQVILDEIGGYEGRKLTIDDVKEEIVLKNGKAQLLMGHLLEATGRKEAAMRLYLKSANLGMIEAKGRVGLMLLKDGRKIDVAERFLKDAAKWKCNSHVVVDENERRIALLNLGILYLRAKKDNEEAIEIFRSLLEMNHPDAASLLTLAYRAAGNKEKANEYEEMAFNHFGSFYLANFDE